MKRRRKRLPVWGDARPCGGKHVYWVSRTGPRRVPVAWRQQERQKPERSSPRKMAQPPLPLDLALFPWWEPWGLICQWVPNPPRESRGNGDHRTPTEGEIGDLCLSKRVLSVMKYSQAKNICICGSGSLGPRERSLYRVGSKLLPFLPRPCPFSHHSQVQGSIFWARKDILHGRRFGDQQHNCSAQPASLGRNQDPISSIPAPGPLDQLPQW